MSPGDLVLLGGLIFPGIVLVAFGLAGLFSPGESRPVRERLRRFHAGTLERIVRTGLFPFPGVRLVSSCRPLLAAEAAFAGILSLSLAGASSLPESALSLLTASAAGCLALYLSLRENARRQIEAVRSTLPVASFLLSLLLEAGTGSHVALTEVAGAIPDGPLSEELAEVSRSRMLGMPRRQALDRSRERVPLDGYHTFLNLIQQGEELGVGLARALREHSERLLEKELQRAEAAAQRAAIRILLPLVVFIFPAVFLVILSPVLLSLWEMWR